MNVNLPADSSSAVPREPSSISVTRRTVSGTSYKFQRLREKLRAAVASGELSGKLPGERALARRFHVNAKTLSKALTDLAAEGILDRSIGRGTYVRGTTPPVSTAGRWLIIAEPTDVHSDMIQALRGANPELQVATNLVNLRPSFLNQFAAVIDTASDTSEVFLRDLVVRNMPVAAVNREPKTYSMHSVLQDVSLGASRLARDLLLAGHRRFAAVEPAGSSLVRAAIAHSIHRYNTDGSVDAGLPRDVRSLINSGVTAIVCGSCAMVVEVRAELERFGINVPGRVSLAAVGCIGDTAPCSGYFCSAHQIAEAVAGLLRDAGSTRPATLWLAGEWHDRGTTGPTEPGILGQSDDMHHSVPA